MEVNISSVSPAPPTAQPPPPTIEARPSKTVVEVEARPRISENTARRDDSSDRSSETERPDRDEGRAPRESALVARSAPRTVAPRTDRALELEDPTELRDADDAPSRGAPERETRTLSDDVERVVIEARSSNVDADAANDSDRDRANKAFRDSVERASVARAAFDFEGGSGSDPAPEADRVDELV